MTVPPPPVVLISEALGCASSSLAADSRLGNHPNWDSVGHLSVMLALERHYGIAIADETIRRYDNVAAIEERYREMVSCDRVMP